MGNNHKGYIIGPPIKVYPFTMSNLAGQFATHGANLLAFINILTSMF